MCVCNEIAFKHAQHCTPTICFFASVRGSNIVESTVFACENWSCRDGSRLLPPSASGTVGVAMRDSDKSAHDPQQSNLAQCSPSSTGWNHHWPLPLLIGSTKIPMNNMFSLSFYSHVFQYSLCRFPADERPNHCQVYTKLNFSA